MLGEYAVKDANGEWVIFRVGEDYARKIFRSTPEGSLYKVEGLEFHVTLLESRARQPVTA